MEGSKLYQAHIDAFQGCALDDIPIKCALELWLKLGCTSVAVDFMDPSRNNYSANIHMHSDIVYRLCNATTLVIDHPVIATDIKIGHSEHMYYILQIEDLIAACAKSKSPNLPMVGLLNPPAPFTRMTQSLGVMTHPTGLHDMFLLRYTLK